MPRFPLNPVETLKLHTSRYGLGDRRTLSQAIEFTGIDTRNRRILGRFLHISCALLLQGLIVSGDRILENFSVLISTHRIIFLLTVTIVTCR